jgi:hypothetical protein
MAINYSVTAEYMNRSYLIVMITTVVIMITGNTDIQIMVIVQVTFEEISPMNLCYRKKVGFFINVC